MRRGRPPVYKGKRVSPARPFPKIHWKKKKLLTVLANRRQWTRDYGTGYSTLEEITTEVGNGLILEQSTHAAPNYLITE